jgi:poly(beta-D-mannuronate) lyase
VPFPLCRSFHREFARGIFLFGLVATSTAFGATRVVDSIAALQAAIEAATPGDTITLKNGTYAVTAAIKVARSGTPEKPIVLAAETVGGVELSGTHGFTVTSPASFVIIQGFRFTHASGTIAIGSGTNHVRFTRNTFQCSGEGAYLTVTGDDAEVDRNEFRDKHTLGNMISVTGTGSQVARKLWIHHNSFHDFANAHGNGAETIRFGLSGLSLSTGAGLVEYNRFVRCVGENELISNKSSGNTYRYNTFLESPGAQLTLRHGNDCVVYGNIFRGTDGLRIFGDRHLIFSNYFEGNTRGINLGNGDGEVADGAKLTSHDRPDQCVVAFNTLIDNRAQYQMDGRANGLGATRTTFANNLIQGGGVVAKIGGPNPDAIWTGNLLWKTGDAGDLPATGFITADPKLVAGADGIFHLSKGSPALAAAAGEYPAVTADQDGQPRPANKKAIGADEFSAAPIAAHLLSENDVGPASR